MAYFWFWALTLMSMICQNVYSNKNKKTIMTAVASFKVRSANRLFSLGLWPKPKSAKIKYSIVQINLKYYSLNVKDAPAKTRLLLNKMTADSITNLWTECGQAVIQDGKTHVDIHITVISSDMTLTWKTSESYTLDIRKSKTNASTLQVSIKADTIYGARHALETFTQLTVIEKTQKTKNSSSCIVSMISWAKIYDEPAYKYRGLLLDTSRHFFCVGSIKRTLDGMAASKMNVFHWHITDTQSFPLESVRVPELSRYGAFSPTLVYTQKDIKHIIEYAQRRGIRVIIEIDGPAHLNAAWEWANTDNYTKISNKNIGPNIGLDNKIVLECGLDSQFNVANQTIYNILRNLYQEIVEYLPKPALFHMGGDEVSRECWISNKQIRKYLDQIGLFSNEDGFLKLWAQYHNKTLRIWDEVNEHDTGEKLPVMLWSSELTNPNHVKKFLDPQRYVIEQWDRLLGTSDLLVMGYRVVLAPIQFWYLDHLEYTWQRMYSFQLPTHKNMLGGEVTMWTEKVDELTLDEYIWPRAAAVAERLWSDPNSTEPRKRTELRLNRHRNRLVARGLDPKLLEKKL